MKVVDINQLKENIDEILKEETIVVDKSSKTKKAVVIPYDDFIKLLTDGRFSKYRGILSKNFDTDDDRYNDIEKFL